jgi:hypothetical protein
MLSFLTDELVWAHIREREDEVRNIHPHTTGWPETERSMTPPNPISSWMTMAFRKRTPQAPQYR